MRKMWLLQFEPQLTLPAPHGVVAEGADEPAGGRWPGDAGEWSGVDRDMRHLLLQRGQVAVLNDAKHVQQAQCGDHLTQVTGNDTGLIPDVSQCVFVLHTALNYFCR